MNFISILCVYWFSVQNIYLYIDFSLRVFYFISSKYFYADVSLFLFFIECSLNFIYSMVFICFTYYFSFELNVYFIVLLYCCSPVCCLLFWFPFEFMLLHTFFYSLFLLMMSVFFTVFILNSKCISCFIDVSFECSLIFDWLYFCYSIDYILRSRFV